MSKNEEQFYGMFRDAFEGYSPEVPAHIYDNVRAGMVRTSVAWKKWSAIALLLIGTGALTLAFWPKEEVLGRVLGNAEINSNQAKVSMLSSNVAQTSMPSACTNTTEFAGMGQNNATNARKSKQNLSSSTSTSTSAGIQPDVQLSQASSDSDALQSGAVEQPTFMPSDVELNEQPVSKTDDVQAEEKPISKKIWPIKVKKTVTIED